jgi:RNA polymerase-binding protein DksA
VAKKSSKKSAKKTSKKSPGKSTKKAGKKATKKASAKKTASSKKKSSKKAAKKSSASKKTSGKSKASSSSTAKARLPKSPLNKTQRKEFKGLLLEKRRSLIGDMNGMTAGALGRNLQDSSGDLSNMPTHPADIGSDNFEQEFNLGLLESERQLLVEINEALERIENGTYGICLGTGEPIGLPRLKARPWCKYGIEYQRMIEKGLVRPGKDDEYAQRQDDDEDDWDDDLDEEDYDEQDEDRDLDADDLPLED